MFVLGNHENYVGSNNLQTSTANQELVPSGMSRLDDFDFCNYQDVHVVINGGSAIYVKANQGVNINSIFSFKVVEAGIEFNWMAVQR